MNQRDQVSNSNPRRPWWRAEATEKTAECAVTPRPGDVCPTCGVGQLAYNGLFQLECGQCGAVADPGVFT